MVKTGQDEDIRNARSDFTPRQRHIGDSRCWTIPILPKLDLSEDLIAINTWELKYGVVEVEDPEKLYANPNVNMKLAGRVEPVLNFMILRWENLRYSYLVVDESVHVYLCPALEQSSERGR